MLAQQLIDASKDGGAAFVAFATMVFLFTGSLFYMDKIRRKREERDDKPRDYPAAAAAATAVIVASTSAAAWARLGNSVS
jgi:hypothetical protein